MPNEAVNPVPFSEDVLKGGRQRFQTHEQCHVVPNNMCQINGLVVYIHSVYV